MEGGERDELVAAVHADLVALRGADGRLTSEKISHDQALRRVCSGGNLLTIAFGGAVEDGLAVVVHFNRAVYRISIEGRDVPMRTISFMDTSTVGDDFAIRFTTYRTHATIEVVRAG